MANYYGYSPKVWITLGDKKKAKAQKTWEEYHARKQALQKLGFEIYCSFRNGNDSSYTYKYNGVKTAFAWDDESDVVRYVENNLERITTKGVDKF